MIAGSFTGLLPQGNDPESFAGFFSVDQRLLFVTPSSYTAFFEAPPVLSSFRGFTASRSPP